MSQPVKQKPETSAPSNHPTVALLIGTALDTTWRMFIPTIGGTVLGVMIDRNFGSTPLATIIGVVIGVGLAGLLIYRQLKKVKT